MLQFLDQTIDWYRGLAVQQQIATTPTDFAILYDNRQAATQAVRLAFEFARAQAAYIVDNTAVSQGHSAVLSQYQSLGQLQARFDKQVKDTQAELDAARQKLSSAAPKDRAQLQAQISELQGELDLANARRDAVHSMLEFVTGSGANALGAGGLSSQIDALARTLPGVADTPAPANAEQRACQCSARRRGGEEAH